MPTDRRAALLDRETLRLTSWLRQTGHTIDGRSDGMMEEVVRAALHAVLPDSDAPTPREAALRKAVAKFLALWDGPHPLDLNYGHWTGPLRAALQAAASTAAAGEGTTISAAAPEPPTGHDVGPSDGLTPVDVPAAGGFGGDVDLAAREAVADALMDLRMSGPWSEADGMTYQEAMRHYADIIVALPELRSRATSETPRETPPSDFGSQIAMRGGLPKDVAARIDAIERGSE